MMGKYELFPYKHLAKTVSEIEAFLLDDSDKGVSVIQKLSNDLNLKPERFLFDYAIHDNKNRLRRLNLKGLNKRREAPHFYTSKDDSGLYIIYGVLDFTTGLHGAILLTSRGEHLHSWTFTKEMFSNGGSKDDNQRNELNSIIDGLEALPDGSIIAVYAYPGIAMKLDWCSKEQWSLDGPRYHHSIEVDRERNTAWTWKDWSPGEMSLLEISAHTGETLRTINLNDVIDANPDIDILSIRQYDEKQNWLVDPWHGNDIEVLPNDISRAFPGFQQGDLLVSLRSLNLVFVMSPDSLEIKWWRIGQTRRQHDPDWQKNGTITIFDNNMYRDYSRVIQLEPTSFKATVLYDGSKHNVYTEARGRHQILPNGNILITSAQQGRILEVTQSGDVVFEFLNTFSDSKEQRLEITGATWIPENFFNYNELPTCKN